MNPKLEWLDPLIHASMSSLGHLDAQIKNVEENGNIWVTFETDGGALASIESNIENMYLLTNAKFHDKIWYEGEPCIAQFYHDRKWYRAIVTKLMTDHEVRLCSIWL